MLRLDLCDFSDAYIIVKRKINVDSNALNNRANNKLVFKNTATFRLCISKIINAFINNAEDLCIFMSMYNLLVNSDNYSMTSESLWNYYRHEVNDDANETVDKYIVTNNKATPSKLFEYKTKIIRKIPAIASRLYPEVVAPLKYWSDFWRSLDLPLINSEIEHNLSWSEDCIISEILRTPKVPTNPASNEPTNHVPPTQTTQATFRINSTKLNVLVITLSINNNIKFLKNIK